VKLHARTLLLLILLEGVGVHCARPKVESIPVAVEKPVVARERSPVMQVSIEGSSVGIYPHPRIWITPEKLRKLKTKAVSSNPVWMALNGTNDAYLRSDKYRDSTDSTVLFNFAVRYMARGSRSDLNAAKTILLNFPARFNINCDGSMYCGNDNIDYGSIHLIYIAVAYDWLFDQLADGERAAVREWVFQKLIPFLHRHPQANDYTHNLGHTKWIGELLWGLATLGEDDRGRELFVKQHSIWKTEIAPTMDKAYPGGHTYGGSGYGYNRSFKWALFGMEALATATTLHPYEEHSWAIDEILYRIHSVLPSGDQFHADWESAEAIFNRGRQTENEALLVDRFQGNRTAGFGQFFIQNVFKPLKLNPYYVGGWYLWYDPSYPAMSYSQEPTAYFAHGSGIGFSRSRWQDPNAAWASFSASSYFGDHQLHNEGSFKIWKNGEYLVIENGRCYAANAGHTTPVDANILFLGNGEVDRGAITGGLPRRGYKNQVNTRYSSGASFAYFEADLTRAYHPSYFPLRYFSRSFLHLKPNGSTQEDIFVLADRIQTMRPMSKTQYLHLPAPSAVNGREALMRSASGKNSLRVISLLPREAQLAAQSVPDKTGRCLPQENTDRPELLTIRGSSSAHSDLFLTVLLPSSTATNVAEVEVIRGEPDLAGVLIRNESVNRGFLFPTKPGGSVQNLRFQIRLNAPVEFVSVGLTPSARYHVESTAAGRSVVVKLNSSPSGNLQSDEQGVITFRIAPALSALLPAPENSTQNGN
jgi:hypothetical protein